MRDINDPEYYSFPRRLPADAYMHRDRPFNWRVIWCAIFLTAFWSVSLYLYLR